MVLLLLWVSPHSQKFAKLVQIYTTELGLFQAKGVRQQSGSKQERAKSAKNQQKKAFRKNRKTNYFPIHKVIIIIYQYIIIERYK